jgi:hypothetical protein
MTRLTRPPPRRANMQKHLIDTTLKGRTIATAEPTDKTRYTVLGKYKSNAEAEKAIASMKQC